MTRTDDQLHAPATCAARSPSDTTNATTASPARPMHRYACSATRRCAVTPLTARPAPWPTEPPAPHNTQPGGSTAARSAAMRSR